MAAAQTSSNPSPIINPTSWPEPIQRVQVLAECGLTVIPSLYIRPESDRPNTQQTAENAEIPVIDLSDLDDKARRQSTLNAIAQACKEWGFFQIVNHGVPLDLIGKTRTVAKDFFQMPLEEKQIYANDPRTYEGYGSRLGVDNGVILDWGDYYFLNTFPSSIRDLSKWPTKPTQWSSETMEEYCQQIRILSLKLLEVFSQNLGLAPSTLKDSFGGKSQSEMCIRINYYPACPQPDLTLGLSSHSDPGGITILLQDEKVEGLQVRHDGRWVAVKPIPGSLVVNLADQIQILTNEKYKSVEHRVTVNRSKERMSIACFFNPGNDTLIAPLQELLDEVDSPVYKAMTFKHYRSFMRRKGTNGKGQVTSLSSPKPTISPKSSIHDASIVL